MSYSLAPFSSFFFFNDTATTEIYTLSLHDALPICHHGHRGLGHDAVGQLPLLRLAVQVAHGARVPRGEPAVQCVDRKSTRLNSSHLVISYAVFCLKKKKKSKRISSSDFRRLARRAH